MLRQLSEFVWALRREGFAIAPPHVIGAARACELVGLDDRERLKRAIGCVVVERRSDWPRFDRAFDAFFRAETAHGADLWGRLRARGFTDDELGALRELLDAAAERSGTAPEIGLASVMGGAAEELDHLLACAGIARTLAPLATPLQVGYFTQRVLDDIGVARATGALSRIRRVLAEALGDARGRALGDAIAEELEALRRRVRRHVEATLERRIAAPDAASAGGRPFGELAPDEAERVRRGLRTLAERLRGAERVRRRRARRGRIDAQRTIRQSLKTGGIPFVPARRKRRRDKAKLVLLCDVSDSVRIASRFFLEFVHAAQELFAGTRSFVFVSELSETTALFAERGIDEALARIQAGEIVSGADVSNYGRVLHRFHARVAADVDRRTTIVLLGDGRTNYHADGADVLRRLSDRARSLYWICPEGPERWGVGDSAMLRYAEACTDVLVARTGRELEEAARRLTIR